jgi:hypothetical protein
MKSTFVKAKFYGPSNTKGSRIKVQVVGEKSFRWVGYSYSTGSVVNQIEKECNAKYQFSDNGWYYFAEGVSDPERIASEIESMIVPFFSERDTLEQAHQYVDQIGKASGARAHMMTAAYVLQNTIARTLAKHIRGN